MPFSYFNVYKVDLPNFVSFENRSPIYSMHSINENIFATGDDDGLVKSIY